MAFLGLSGNNYFLSRFRNPILQKGCGILLHKDLKDFTGLFLFPYCYKDICIPEVVKSMNRNPSTLS